MATDGTGAVTQKSYGVPVIDCSRCSGCGRCVASCPEKIITLEVSGYRKHARISPAERCTSCGVCVASCPVAAIYP